MCCSVLQCAAVCCSITLRVSEGTFTATTLQRPAAHCNTLHHSATHCTTLHQTVFRAEDAGWQRLIACLKLQVIFRKRATNYMTLLRKLTYEDKASYDSTPPCIKDISRRDICYSTTSARDSLYCEKHL